MIDSNAVGNVRHRHIRNLLKRLREVDESGKISIAITRVPLKLHAATESVAHHRKTKNFSQLLNSRYELISENES
jgi:3-polyprenyl-4-hydroxybenzoate decarboxylase